MRFLKEIIVHSTATPEGMDVQPESIREWHKERGFSDIGYHFIIMLNGDIRQGRPLAEMGAHCKRHNKGTVGIAYAGGTDGRGKAKDTRTDAQKEAMKRLIMWLVWKYGIWIVSGHRDYTATQCPSFNAKAEYQVYVDWMYRDRGYYEESVHGEYYLRAVY